MNLAAEIDANLRLRLCLHADAWPGGDWNERDGMLLTRLRGSPHLQSGVAAATTIQPFEQAAHWYGDQPFTLWLPGQPVVDDADVVEEIAGMAAPVDGLANPGAAIDIRVVNNPQTRDALHSLATGFALARTTVERLFPPTLLENGSALVGFVDDEPVTACWSVMSGTVTGLYGVITAANHRGRGYAHAVVASAAQRAAAGGFTHLVLQTAAAIEAFAAMGFAEVSRYRVVAPVSMRS